MSESLTNFAELYKNRIVPELKKELGVNSVIQCPKVEYIIISMSVNEAITDSKAMAKYSKILSMIAGQMPIIVKARKSIAAFKTREGMSVACKVTLRGRKMYYFLERLLYVVLPSMRDFRGFSSKSFDGNGNLSIGIKNILLFPEVSYDEVDSQKGLNVTIVTSAKDDLEGKKLLSKFNFPFKD